MTGRINLSIDDRIERRENWRARSICGPEHDSIMFSERNGRGPKKEIEQAKQLCARCPVQSDCYMWAEETNQRFGVWGGFDFSSGDKSRRRQLYQQHKKELA